MQSENRRDAIDRNVPPQQPANADIAFVEECMLAGSLVEFLYEDVDYDGVPSGKIIRWQNYSI